MRIILKLKPNGKFINDNTINHKIQGFIYKLLEDTFFSDLHNKKGSKYFCFSNIFKKENDDLRYLIISSPIREIIDIISKKIKIGKEINIGDYSFTMINYKKTNIDIKDNIKIRNSTPIILRIPRDKFTTDETKNKFKYYYWRKEFGLDIFIEQLSANMIKKYEKFFGVELDRELKLFESYRFVKEVSHMMQIGGKNSKLIGSYWEFETIWLDNLAKDIIRLSLDAGLGEMNSLGFGFTNSIA